MSDIKKTGNNNKKRALKRALVQSTAITAFSVPMLLGAGTAFAQEDNTEILDEIVVVGTSQPKEKLEVINAVTTFNEEKLKRLAPNSIGDLVRGIPGFHAENTGGETGNNIAPRGFPLSTQQEFNAILKDGLTVFYNQDILFTQGDRFTRFSSFLTDVQAVRGGSSSIYVGNSPAGFIDLISREGGDETEAEFALKADTNSGFGVEGWVSGSLSDQITYAVGGWWRQNDSPRDPGFIANDGGEINANLKYTFDEGYTKFEFNVQDDKNIFIVPQPLTGSTTNVQTIPGGPSAVNGTVGHSSRARILDLPGTPDGDLFFDLRDGNHTQAIYFGNTTEYDVSDNWTIRNQARYTDLSAPFTGIINVGNATLLSATAQGIFDDNSALLTNAQDVNGDVLFEVREAGTGLALANQSNADSFNTNGFGIAAGFWNRDYEGDNFQNDTRLQYERLGDNSKLFTTFGFFFSNLNGRLEDHWTNTLQSVEPSPQRLDIVFVDEAGNDVASGTHNGLLPGFNLFNNIVYTERTFAPYIDAEYQIGNLDINVGARYEILQANGEVENVQSVALGDIFNGTDALSGLATLPFGDGTFRNFDLQYEELAWTIGANYQVADDIGIFARYADGFRLPDVDKYLQIRGLETEALTPEGQCSIELFRDSECPLTAVTSTTMAELGLKYFGERGSVFVTGYFASADDLSFNVPTVDPVTNMIVNRDAFRNTETFGIELEADANVVGGLNVGASFTWQDPKFVNTPIAEAIVDGMLLTADINGNLPVRVPETFGQVRAYYEFEDMPWGRGSLNASYDFSGRRFADDANTAELPSYGILNLGASMETEDGFFAGVEAKNVTNEVGLTEGDPRAGETIAGQTPTFNARLTLPRTVTFKVGKRF